MTSWRDLPAGPELDILVAKRLGWRITVHDQQSYSLSSQNGWVGLEVNQATWRVDEDSAWRDVFTQHIGLGGIAHWSTDANATLYAPDAELDLRQYGSACYARYTIPVSSRMADHSVLYEEAPTLALARVRAWLAHMDRQDAPRAVAQEVSVDKHDYSDMTDDEIRQRQKEIQAELRDLQREDTALFDVLWERQQHTTEQTEAQDKNRAHG